MAGRRWGPNAPGTAGDARKLLVEAAGRVVMRRGVARTSLADVAAEVDVTRPTVYRHFSSKEAIVEALILSLVGPYAERTMPRIAELAGRIDEPSELVAAIVADIVKTLPAEPWFGPMFHGESAVVTTAILLGSDTLLSAATELLAPAFASAAAPSVPPRAIVELGIRVILSYAVVAPRDPHETGDALALLGRLVIGSTLPPPIPIAKGMNPEAVRARTEPSEGGRKKRVSRA